MTHDPTIAEWQGLHFPAGPAGNLAVRLGRRALQHVAEKHIADTSEPWDDWMGADLRQRLAAWGTCGGPVAEDDLREAAEKLRPLVAKSLATPLVLMVETNNQSNAPDHVAWRIRWQLILPNGASMVVGCRAGRYRVLTCFFCWAAAGSKPASRWRAAAHRVVQTRLRLEPGVGFLPLNSREVQGEMSRWERKIAFVSLANWGFRTLHGADVWMRLTPAWPGDVQPAAPQKPRFKLGLRRTSFYEVDML